MYEQEQDPKQNVEYIRTSTSILNKNNTININDDDDDDDDILDPKTALMHSDLATITELSTDIDDDDLTLVSSHGSSSVIQNKYKATSYRHSSKITSTIKEGENESQSASSFSNKLDLMESQLKHLRQQQLELSSDDVDVIPMEPMDIQEEKQEIQNPSEQQYHDFSNVISSFLLQNNYEKKDDYFDDSSTITSMQTKIKHKKPKPVILFECPSNLNQEQNLFSTIPEDRVKSSPIQQELNHIPEEISVEKSEKKKKLTARQSLSSLTPTVAMTSDEDRTTYNKKQAAMDEVKEIIQKEEEESIKSNEHLIITKDNNDSDIRRDSMKRTNAKKKNKQRKVIKYTVIILLFLVVIVLSNFLTKYFSDGKDDVPVSSNIDFQKDDPIVATNSTVGSGNSTSEDTRERGIET